MEVTNLINYEFINLSFKQKKKWFCGHCHGGDGPVAGGVSRTNFKSLCREFFKDGTKTPGIHGSSVTDSRDTIGKPHKHDNRVRSTGMLTISDQIKNEQKK